jgi:Fur family ferric uptake transcriptional regulator
MPNSNKSLIEKLCEEKKIKLTENRAIIARIISKSNDHPDVEEVYRRACKVNPKIGIATVYRTVRLFEELGVVTKHDFGGNKSRYEVTDDSEHHDHIIDVSTNKVIEFFDQELEELKEKIARAKGYELVGHKLELYCRPISNK